MMKSLITLSFALSLYLLASPAQSTFNPIRLPTAHEAAASSDDDTPVKDINGDDVRAGENYYIKSATGDAVVRLLNSDLKDTCPTDVFVSPIPLDHNADRITITPVDHNSTVVLPSTYLSFKFNPHMINSLCVGQLTWMIQYRSTGPQSGQYFVKTGDYAPENSNLFKIEVVSPELNTYKITNCMFGPDEHCLNVGISINMFLALSDSPFVFQLIPSVDE